MRIRDAMRHDATRRETTRHDARRGQASSCWAHKFRFIVSPMVREQWLISISHTRFLFFPSFRSSCRIVSMSSLGGIDLDRSINGLFKIIVTMTLWIIGYRRCIEPCKIRLWKSSSDFDANLIGILVQTRKPNLRSVNSKGFESIDSNELMLAMLGFAAVIGER